LNIIEAYNVENCIGMHIRMEGGRNYQTQKADKEALWTEEERKMMFKWRECSHIDNFINQINHILHENPDEIFYIATDLESNYEKLLRLYGESRIKYLKRSVFDRSKLQQCYALADILLLSRCKMFYGSYWSSFSELVTYFQTDVIRKDNVFSNTFHMNHLSKKQNLFGKQLQDGNSIVSVCMNRYENLSKSIFSWLNAENCDEIIILDYSSKEPIKEKLQKKLEKFNFNSHKIKYFRVENVASWHLTKAYNLAIKLANYTCIYKLDCDDIIDRQLLNMHKLNNSYFYSGYWEDAKDINSLQIAGKLFVTYENFIKVNGYNENITSYGWDDSDIIERLSKNILRKRIDINQFQFVPHDEITRRNDNIKNWNSKKNIQLNRILTTEKNIYQWSNKYLHSIFTYNETQNTFLLTKSFHLMDKFIDQKTYNNVINFLNSMLGS